ncbi:hypothetical protein PR202_ga22383 [Eleusine coracana subsp. coracana]|uniref:Leucine-rich repeat-containing N-terminal plant-type domain-containing protein n=1 Tax=Eleusine coracana subsp. coracana TaxID=191504 RepID=A0AAV5D3W8_ELECO|nr:hypothetical protein PR202_ga22383 [Eleusine coracana subsp. coracana]
MPPADTATLPRTHACTYLHLLVVLLPCCGLHAALPQLAEEARLLLQIKSVWGDPPVLASWNVSATAAHCRWPYVRCNKAGHVSGLFLANTKISGPFPGSTIASLSGLRHIDVFNNTIADVFPTLLYRCRSLQYLNLSYNLFNGELPANIGHGLAASLTTLDLSGTIPASLSRLQNLKFLALDNNLFVGCIPAKLGELTSLQAMYLGDNSFDAGELPPSFGKLANLSTLDAQNCNLVGSIPPGIWTLETTRINSIQKQAHRQQLYKNNFSGEIPTSIGWLPSLQLLIVGTNRLNGTLPSELGKHTSALKYVAVYDNELTGVIPEGLCDRSRLQYFIASGNQLNGSIPAGLANCATLKVLVLDSNQLSGQIPQAIIWTVLTIFTASNNLFSGEIPASLVSSMPLVQKLNLSGNQLSGWIA